MKGSSGVNLTAVSTGDQEWRIPVHISTNDLNINTKVSSNDVDIESEIDPTGDWKTQSDWKETNTLSMAYIKNKPDITNDDNNSLYVRAAQNIVLDSGSEGQGQHAVYLESVAEGNKVMRDGDVISDEFINSLN